MVRFLATHVFYVEHVRRANRQSFRQRNEPMRGYRAAGFAVEVERVGPGDDRAGVALAAEVGEGGEEELAAEAAVAFGFRDACRTEPAEVAVVGFVGGEAGDFVFVFDEEDRSARGFEAPD